MDHITVETVVRILWDVALLEILLIGATLFRQAGHIITTWLLTDNDEPKKIEAPKAELKKESEAEKETITEIDGIH